MSSGRLVRVSSAGRRARGGLAPGAAGTLGATVSAAAVSAAAESAPAGGFPWRLSSTGRGSTEASRTGVESGSSDTRTADSWIRWRGSSDWLNSTVADTLSTGVTARMRGGAVSWTKAQNSTALSRRPRDPDGVECLPRIGEVVAVLVEHAAHDDTRPPAAAPG